jgi:hypothetical protein
VQTSRSWGAYGRAMLLPAFRTEINSLAYGKDATEVYHDRGDCQRAQKILEDRNEMFGEGGRRLCSECRALRGDLEPPVPN